MVLQGFLRAVQVLPAEVWSSKINVACVLIPNHCIKALSVCERERKNITFVAPSPADVLRFSKLMLSISLDKFSLGGALVGDPRAFASEERVYEFTKEAEHYTAY